MGACFPGGECLISHRGDAPNFSVAMRRFTEFAHRHRDMPDSGQAEGCLKLYGRPAQIRADHDQAGAVPWSDLIWQKKRAAGDARAHADKARSSAKQQSLPAPFHLKQPADEYPQVGVAGRVHDHVTPALEATQQFVHGGSAALVEDIKRNRGDFAGTHPAIRLFLDPLAKTGMTIAKRRIAR